MLTSNYSDFNLKLIIVKSVVFKFGFKKKMLLFCLSWAPQPFLGAIYFWRSLKCQTVRRQSGGHFQKSHVWDASIVALVLLDLTLFLTAAQNTERQAINLWGKKKYRFRDTWKQPTGMDQMDFSSLCPFFFTWAALGGERKSLKGKIRKGISYQIGLSFCPRESPSTCINCFHMLGFKSDLWTSGVAIDVLHRAQQSLERRIFFGLIANLQKGSKNNWIEVKEPTYSAVSKRRNSDCW